MSREGVSGRVHVVDLDEGGTATGKKDWVRPGNTKGGSITLPLTFCLTGLD